MIFGKRLSCTRSTEREVLGPCLENNYEVQWLLWDSYAKRIDCWHAKDGSFRLGNTCKTKPLNTTATNVNLMSYYDREAQKIISYHGNFNTFVLRDHHFNEDIDCISSFGYTDVDDMDAMVIVWSTESKTSTLYFWHTEHGGYLKPV